MRSLGTLGLGVVALFVVSTPAVAQRDDSFKWYVGGQAGVFGFETPTQSRGWAPSVGGNLLVVSKRTGLLISVEEAFGSEEGTGFGDNQANGGVRTVQFDRIRKYSAILTAFPIRGNTQPYLGVGFGLLQVLDPEPLGFFTSPVQAATSKNEANDRSTNGFIAAVAGVQFRAGSLIAFGQFQLNSSARPGSLLSGPGMGLTGGLRFPLGNAKEGIHGGGY